MEYTPIFRSATTTPCDINEAGLRLNTQWEHPIAERVTGLILGTACDKPMLVNIPIRPSRAVAVDYWLPLTRGYMEHPPECNEIRTRKFDPFPCQLPHDYLYFFFDQTLENPVNRCIAVSARHQAARAFYGDVVVVKRDAFDRVVDMEESDIRLVSSMAIILSTVG
ncbi:hypothetical protein BJ138DRAFT_50001 [Hygrophoropsis aurantiaca]|uniref:Uncharacterized protein n=1 Tax=Hygrophoropsis aurantiaca TaxID=72124 RepID=A0ACB7ZUF8_9AGAM|nr:hypothetical protein BJ138DRAFT_50001 [Hygrophoropsis aurantiaca]